MDLWRYNEGGETARRQCFFFVSPLRKFPRLPHDTIPNAATAKIAHRQTRAGNLLSRPFGERRE